MVRRLMHAGLVALALLASCGDQAATEVVVVFDATATARAAATQIQVRVWGDDGLLVLDRLEPLERVALPLRLPIAAAGGDGSRRYHAEAELFTSELCPAGRAVAAGQFEPDVSRVVNALIEDEGAFVACRPVFVAADGADDDAGACESPSTPCRTLEQTFWTYLQTGRADVLYVRGGESYGGLTANEMVAAPVGRMIIRQWPGTGVPRLDGRESSPPNDFITMGSCCDPGAGMITSADDVLWDGFEVVGGRSMGAQLNGATASRNTIRNCYIHDNGDAPSCPMGECTAFDAGLQLNNLARDNVIEFNVISMNHSNDVRPDGTIVDAMGIYMNGRSVPNVVRFNRIVGNQGVGIEFAGAGSLLLRNLLMGNGKAGVDISDGPDLHIEHNAVADNGGDGLYFGGGSAAVLDHNTVVRNGGDGIHVRASDMIATIRNNIVAYNAGFGLRHESPGAGEPMDSYNLLFDNVMGAREGIVSDAPETEVERDPRLRALRPVDFALLADSPARGAAPDGSDLGARPLTTE